MAEGIDCRGCRSQYEAADQSPPCDEDGGLLPDGTCIFGMPELLEENVRALVFWQDVNLLGPELAMFFSRFDMTNEQRGDMLAKLRVLADEAERIKRAKSKGTD